MLAVSNGALQHLAMIRAAAWSWHPPLSSSSTSSYEAYIVPPRPEAGVGNINLNPEDIKHPQHQQLLQQDNQWTSSGSIFDCNFSDQTVII